MEDLRQQLEKCRSGFDAVVREVHVGYLVIIPILEKLGWSLEDRTIDPEYPIDAGKVDFALLNGKTPAVLIEAKAPGKLNAKGETQLFDYARNHFFDNRVEMLLILTDGEEWLFYLTSVTGKQPADRQFEMFNLKKDNIDGVADKLANFLGKERVVGGAAQKSAMEKWNLNKELKKLKTDLPEILNGFHQNIPEQWARDIAEKVKETLHIDCSTEEIRSAVRDSYSPLRANEPHDFHMPNSGTMSETAWATSGRLIVHYNGDALQESNDTATFLKVISVLGVDRVYKVCRESNIKNNRYHVVLKKDEVPIYKDRNNNRKIYRTGEVGNYKVMVNSSTTEKKSTLSAIARALNVTIKIE